jgi:hypothetical protein
VVWSIPLAGSGPHGAFMDFAVSGPRRSSGRFLPTLTPFALGLLLGACANTPDIPDTGPPDAGALEPDAGSVDMACPEGTDLDGDTIPDAIEGTEDVDGDGTANLDDLDADGDSIPDIVEAGDTICDTPAPDLDGDGIPDFLDPDANKDNINDSFQVGDTNENGVPDWQDLDTDGDGLSNIEEWGDEDRPRDFDGDGTPDVLDLDSDGDTISDEQEGGTSDVDQDGMPSHLDLDSDGDGALDSLEAGDADLATRPFVCQREIDPATGEIGGDGIVDFLDSDSDNDGLSDGAEVALGTDRCRADSDGDGVGDLEEGAYERFNCIAEGDDACGCAASPRCTIPDEFFLVRLPFGPDQVERDLDFSTNIEVADIFFLSDITGSMSTTLMNVQSQVATDGGLIDTIRDTIPQAWFGGGTFQDFPMNGHGGGTDEAFTLVTTMTDDADAVAAAWGSVMASGGADGPESHTEALYQAITGVGGTWTGGTSGSGSHMIPAHNLTCPSGTFGAPCFRQRALPIFIFFTDVCAHNGPPRPDGTIHCDPYDAMEFDPYPAEWQETMEIMLSEGARFIGVNASPGTDCVRNDEDGDPLNDIVVGDPSVSNNCYFLEQTAIATESQDRRGRPFVYDIPQTPEGSARFVSIIGEAVEALARGIAIDVETTVEDDLSDEVDATQFIVRRQPKCFVGEFPCHTPPPPPSTVTFEEAVASYDMTTFYEVIPGTTVTFRLTFRNTIFKNETPRTRIFLSFVNVVGQGGAVLDTRQVYVVVPGTGGGLN